MAINEAKLKDTLKNELDFVIIEKTKEIEFKLKEEYEKKSRELSRETSRAMA
jgi:hypothetical protein